MSSRSPIPPRADLAGTSNQRLAGQRQIQGVPVKAAKGEFRQFRVTLDGATPIRLNADNTRCYFFVQNNSAAIVNMSFGSDATSVAGIRLTPTSSYEPPICPVNEISFFGPANSFVDIIIGSDAGV